MLLRLAAAQLEAAVDSASADVDVLAEAVGRMVSIARSPDEFTTARADEMVRAADNALRAMQHHDPLRQRIDHVRDLLRNIASVIDETSIDASTWEILLRDVRSQYSLQAERDVFDRFVRSGPQIDRAPMATESRFGDIELF